MSGCSDYPPTHVGFRLYFSYRGIQGCAAGVGAPARRGVKASSARDDVWWRADKDLTAGEGSYHGQAAEDRGGARGRQGRRTGCT